MIKKWQKFDINVIFCPNHCIANNLIFAVFQDLDNDPIQIGYAKNGVDLGACYYVEKSQLLEKVMFPHLLSKNTSFECNFGAKVRQMFVDVF